jgi:hypothetical protein
MFIFLAMLYLMRMSFRLPPFIPTPVPNIPQMPCSFYPPQSLGKT